MRFCLNYLQFRVSKRRKEAEMNHSDMPAPLCDDDFVLWMEHQIQLLRDQQFSQLDLPNLSAELEYLVSKQKISLRSRLRVLILHLLKCEFQPAMRSPSWIRTINTQRRKIEELIEASPSLARQIEPWARAQYRKAERDAVRETGLPKSTFPQELCYSEQQLLDLDFIPHLP